MTMTMTAAAVAANRAAFAQMLAREAELAAQTPASFDYRYHWHTGIPGRTGWVRHAHGGSTPAHGHRRQASRPDGIDPLPICPLLLAAAEGGAIADSGPNPQEE